MSTKIEELTDLINDLKSKISLGDESRETAKLLQDSLDELKKLNEQLNAPGKLLKD
jgi:prefoldin subunit 5